MFSKILKERFVTVGQAFLLLLFNLLLKAFWTNRNICPTIFLTSFFLFGCGVTQPVRTIEEGRTEIISSFGGPVIPFDGLAIPAPYLNIGTLYGFSSDLTLFGNAHVTALLFKDVGLDAGAATTLLHEHAWYPEVTLNSRLYFFWDFIRSNNKRIFPMVSFIASYETGSRSLLYFGLDNVYQIHKPELFVSPLTGYQFPMSDAINAQLEVKWLAANKDTRHGVFEGVTSIAGQGGIGIFFGMQYSLK
ncbi:MAG: hypothetical protein HYV29_09395 [Ignavibacteriales bacterium]|nr:hypothetical protein [Ignavibacteriales bacterium]